MSQKSIATNRTPEKIECPLCRGAGEITRAEVLDRLGAKDFARVAQLSAEEAFRLLLSKHKQDEQSVWSRFETELTKRMAEITQSHNDQLHTLTARTKELETTASVSQQQNALEIQRVNHQVEGYLREVSTLRERNQILESELSKVARVGRREELDFAEEARAWPGVHVSDKLPKNGDFILAFRDRSGSPVHPSLLVDNKDKAAISETDLDKLIPDAKERSLAVAALVARDESQLRQIDKNTRWGCKDGIWLLRTTRNWLPRDLEVLKPLFDRMRVHGAEFLDKNLMLAVEVRNTFADLDRIDKELGKAAKAIHTAAGLTNKYKIRLHALCDDTSERISPDAAARKAAGA